MPRRSCRPFAPRWLRSFMCVVAMLPFLGVIASILFAHGGWYSVVIVVPTGYVFLHGLHPLISGRPSRSVLSFAAEGWRGRLLAKHGEPRSGSRYKNRYAECRDRSNASPLRPRRQAHSGVAHDKRDTRDGHCP